jgi:GT2 family glycosyltransferase
MWRVLSFIVPAYNEEFELPRTLQAIREAAGDEQHEIIVVDDGSTDRTAAVAHEGNAKVVPIHRRQIAAARNAGARAAQGEVLFFVDADTRINRKHVTGALAALDAGYVGGGARVAVDGNIPRWARIALHFFCFIYFALNFGAGAFLFTTRENFESAGGLDESLFIGEEVYFSLALRKLGRFKILDEPITTSGRKLRMYSAPQILKHCIRVFFSGPRVARSRTGLEIWYDGKRETSSPNI